MLEYMPNHFVFNKSNKNIRFVVGVYIVFGYAEPPSRWIVCSTFFSIEMEFVKYINVWHILLESIYSIPLNRVTNDF